MYNGYGVTTSASYGAGMGTGAMIWTIVSAILALIGGIVLYFTVFANKNEDKYKGFMAWLYDFIKFKKLYITTVLKISYLVGAIFLTLFSFALISVSFLLFLIILTIGNLVLRMIYEFSLVLLSIHENVAEINKKMKK